MRVQIHEMGGWIRISFQLSAASLLMQALVENA